MNFSDIVLLIKKILVGVVVTLIPALILYWGLRFTQTMLTKPAVVTTSIDEEKIDNQSIKKSE